MKKPFDILNELGKFGAEQQISLRDPGAKNAFAAHVAEAVDRALADPLLIYGQRTEAMFEALLVSLGEYRLLKPEDNGRAFPVDRFAASDFRVVLNDGAQWLIEVKNVYEAEPFAQTRKLLDRDYLGRLSAYAKATGGELKLAIFWARWSLWTLVSPDRLVDGNGDLTLDMMTAMKVNELGQLGDRSIGTRAPLRLRLTADQTRTGPIGSDGSVVIVFGGSQAFCEDREIVDPVELEIAWIFMQHGDWEADCEGRRDRTGKSIRNRLDLEPRSTPASVECPHGLSLVSSRNGLEPLSRPLRRPTTGA